MGAAALIDEDVTIKATLGGEGKQVTLTIKDGELQNKDLYVHFPIPMTQAWDNVTYTCSTMLLFSSEEGVDQ
ncbi:hypothetical protein NEPTK9_001712 [Candidatus Neptunochlamydia vexilliferae]|uniref:Uncharacterized protein n=1 Tax=Candidatus Neptunichlamydia vexilliferae TaxID=1651774 RepID=A0ABS0B1C6_9BACT|nr:hypothetical protein [Candidatus Neptunochlamydia vexilliferae]